MKIVYMGTPEFSVTVLDYLVKNNFDIQLVVTQPDKQVGRGKKVTFTKVKEYAVNNNLNVIQPNNINDCIEEIKKLNPDFIITCAYGQFLCDELLALAKVLALNVHASLLPKHRGGAPIHRAILNGDSVTGISIMEMVSKMDAGDVYVSSKVDILDSDTLETVHDKLSHLGGELLVRSLEDIYKGNIKPVVQDEKNVTYSPNISKEERVIGFDNSARDIFNKVRAFNPFPMAYAIYKEKMIKIHNVEILDSCCDKQPGTIINISIDGIEVATKDFNLLIKKLQLPNKRAVDNIEFYNGNSLLVENTMFE